MAEELRLQGNKAFSSGDYTTALDLYNQAFDEATEDEAKGTILSNRSLTKMRLGSLEEAKQDAELCISLRPEWFRGYSRLASVYTAQRHPTLAAIEKKKEGNTYHKIGDYAKAISAYSEGIKLDAKNATNYCNRCASYTAQGSYYSLQCAVKDAQKTIELLPDWERGYTRLVTAQQSLGQYEQALSVISSASQSVSGTVATYTQTVTKARDHAVTGFRTLLGELFHCPTGSVRGSDVLMGASRIGLYFSAHWCPPCRQFTPMLVETYTQLKRQNAGLEIVFVSSDHSESEWRSYMQETQMPWLAINYSNSARTRLGSQYGVQGIPALVILRPNGSVVTTDARGDVMNYRNGCVNRW